MYTLMCDAAKTFFVREHSKTRHKPVENNINTHTHTISTLIGCQDLLSTCHCCMGNNDDGAEYIIPLCYNRKDPACHSGRHRLRVEAFHPRRLRTV